MIAPGVDPCVREVDETGMQWLVLLLALLPLALFALFVRRVMRVVQRLRDPEQLRSLLSEEVRAALLEAGIDPDSVSVAEIQKSEKLRRIIAPDLNRAFRSALLGRSLPESRVFRGTSRLPTGHDSGPASPRWSHRAASHVEQPQLPPPIDPPSGPGARVVVALVVAALIVITALLVFSQQ